MSIVKRNKPKTKAGTIEMPTFLFLTKVPFAFAFLPTP